MVYCVRGLGHQMMLNMSATEATCTANVSN